MSRPVVARRAHGSGSGALARVPARDRAPVRALTACVVTACVLTACAGSASSFPARANAPAVLTVSIPADAADVMTRLLAEAQAHGAAIVAESADAFVADFGVRRASVAVDGLAPTLVTEVHDEARYRVRAERDRTIVTIVYTPSYWSPDTRCWVDLPGASFRAAPRGPSAAAKR